MLVLALVGRWTKSCAIALGDLHATLDMDKGYLDTYSNMCQLPWEGKLEDMHAASKALHANCNSGQASSNKQGIMARQFRLWLAWGDIANLISVTEAKQKGSVTDTLMI